MLAYRVSGYNLWKNGGITYSESFYTINSQMRIHDTSFAQWSHSAGTRRMIQRLHPITDNLFKLFVTLLEHFGVHERIWIRMIEVGCQGFGLGDIHDEP